MAEQIVTKLENNVLHIILNRPEKKNAITDEMYVKLISTLNKGEVNAKVKTYLIYGNGDCFCTGKDLKDFQDLKLFSKERENPSSAFMKAIIEVKKPIIGAVHGYAVGIGATMLLHFDLLYAATVTKFRFPFINLGLIPEFGSTFLLPTIIGKFRASELFLFGDFFTAEDAYKMRLINQIFQENILMESVINLAEKLAEKPMIALTTTKQLVKKNYNEILLKRISEEGKEFAKRQVSLEAQEAFVAFFEKRKPNFSKFE